MSLEGDIELYNQFFEYIVQPRVVGCFFVNSSHLLFDLEALGLCHTIDDATKFLEKEEVTTVRCVRFG